MRYLKAVVIRKAGPSLALMGALIVSGPAAYAGFAYTPATAPNPAPKVNLTGYQLIAAPAVVQIGRGRVRVARGFFQEAPLSTVLAGLIPKGWHVYGKEVSWSCPVSWVGPSPWIAALREVMRQSGAVAHVVWSRRMVLVQPRRALDARACQASGVIAKASPPLSSPRHVLAGGTLKVAPSHRVWIVHAGAKETVRATLKRWGRIAHVRVFWHTNEDWPIVARATFPGSFAQAVHGLLTAVDQQGVGLRGRLYNNHVLVITQTHKGRMPQ